MKTLSVADATSLFFHPAGKLISQSLGCGFQYSAELTAVPPPKTLNINHESANAAQLCRSLEAAYQPDMTPVSSHTTPVPSAQISLKSPGTSKRVKFVPCSQDGFIVPFHLPLDGGPFSIKSTDAPDSLSLSATTIPPAPDPTTM